MRKNRPTVRTTVRKSDCFVSSTAVSANKIVNQPLARSLLIPRQEEFFIPNDIKPNPYSDARTDAWWGEQQKLQAELEKRGYPDPRTTTGWDYQAQIAGYEDGEEFKQAYIKRAVKAGGIGVAAGVGLFAGAFGISAGSIVAGPKLAAVAGFVARAGSRAIVVAKNVGVKAWNMAKSAHASLSGAAATPQGREVVKNITECVGGATPGSPAPGTLPAGFCNATSEFIRKLENE